MNDQLLGVIVGAAIGFLGPLLVTLFQWYMEREKRREDRLWHYRQEHIHRVRPSWEQLSASLYDLLDMVEDGLIWLDRAAATEGIEEAEDLKREFDKQFQRMHEQADKLTARLSEIPAQMWTVLTMHDPDLGPSVRSQIGEALQSVSAFAKVVESLRYEPRPDSGLSPAQIAEVKNQLNEC